MSYKPVLGRVYPMNLDKEVTPAFRHEFLFVQWFEEDMLSFLLRYLYSRIYDMMRSHCGLLGRNNRLIRLPAHAFKGNLNSGKQKYTLWKMYKKIQTLYNVNKNYTL
jgi:hypothetical protein